MKNIKYIKDFLPFQFYKIRKNESVKNFCEHNSIDINRLIFEKENLEIGDIVLYCNPNLIKHVVLPLETLESIALTYKTTPEIIRQNNTITRLFIGQQIYV